MCVMSVITKQYDRVIPSISWPQQPYYPPIQTQTSVDLEGLKPKTEGEVVTANELREILKSFRLAVEAAEIIDEVTGQKDCVDPVKAQLFDRVEALEKTLEIIAFNDYLEVGRDVLGDEYVDSHKKVVEE